MQCNNHDSAPIAAVGIASMARFMEIIMRMKLEVMESIVNFIFLFVTKKCATDNK